jgi:hypothetical protein
VANVIREGYASTVKCPASGNGKGRKVLAIQKEIEEATSLELPMLEKTW